MEKENYEKIKDDIENLKYKFEICTKVAIFKYKIEGRNVEKKIKYKRKKLI